MLQEWPISEVARATGLTSRTLRHYEQIGLLRPIRVAQNGYRFYGEAELSRLYRILSLRALGLPLSEIDVALTDDRLLAEAMREHLAILETQQDRIQHQITQVTQTLKAFHENEHLSIDDIFAGFDPALYETEVRQRWGDTAWQQSVQRREQMTPDERIADDLRNTEVNAALRYAAESQLSPSDEAFQSLIGAHHRWVTEHWNGRQPDRAAYTGLAEMYVADPRFAATYGGRANAEVVCSAMHLWIKANLA